MASTPEIVAKIEERIGQLHVDDLERRKSNIKCFLAEETGFVVLSAGIFLKSGLQLFFAL